MQTEVGEELKRIGCAVIDYRKFPRCIILEKDYTNEIKEEIQKCNNKEFVANNPRANNFYRAECKWDVKKKFNLQ
jgi:hypothetical protein